WSRYEATERRARVMTYFGGYSGNYHWQSGVALGGTLKAGRIFLESDASGIPSKNGTLLALSLPEARISLGWGFEAGATTIWEFCKTEFNSSRHRWVFDFT